jgi:hypothetical protein
MLHQARIAHYSITDTILSLLEYFYISTVLERIRQSLSPSSANAAITKTIN